MAIDEARLQAWGRLAGMHALPTFGATLLLLLALVAALAWVARRHVVPRLESPLPPGGFLVLNLGVGFLIVVVSASIFAGTADEIGAGEALGALDTAFSAAVRDTVSRPALRAFAIVTRFGDTLTLTLLGVGVALLLVRAGRHWMAAAWVAAVGGNGVLNTALKGVFERVRPVHDHGLVHEAGWSFPSGHSSGAVVAYGMLAYVLIRRLEPRWHLPVLLGATAIAYSTGWSRVFLQVHYASDVVAGFASGLAWLTACIVSVELTRRYRRRLG